MKKMRFLVPPVALLLLSGCSAMFGKNDMINANYSPMVYNTGYNPMNNTSGAVNSTYHSSGKPQPYSVTPTDQVKYDALSQQIQQREQTLKNNTPNTGAQAQPVSNAVAAPNAATGSTSTTNSNTSSTAGTTSSGSSATPANPAASTSSTAATPSN